MFSIFLRVCALALTSCLPAFAALADGQILVETDRAQILRLDQPAGSIIIGNPGIADATVQDVRTLVLTGKSVGSTNIIILDGEGNEMLNRVVEVTTPSNGAMTVYKGPVRESFSCSPVCEPTLKVGDNKDYFENLLAATTSKNAQATGAGAAN